MMETASDKVSTLCQTQMVAFGP